MSAKPLSEKLLIEASQAVSRAGSIAGGARELNIAKSTMQHRLKLAKEQGIHKNTGKTPPSTYSGNDEFEIEDLPDPEASVDEIIEQAIKTFERRSTASKAREWFNIKIKMDGPFGIASFGDPHIDDNGCNWTLLKRDVEIVKNTEAVWGLGLGDYTNNWSGRLVRLYAEQEITRSKALRLAEWFFKEIPWMVLIKGNHDLWSSQIGSHGDPLDFMERGVSPLEDWQAKIRITCPNNAEFKIWAAHDFSGHSIYNPLHSNMRKAKFTGALADVYISGDKHNWAMLFNEDPDHRKVYWAIRARGYKFIDEYASRLGYADQEYGATILTVFDPYAEGPGRIQCFADLEEGVEFLQWKREKFKKKL